MVPMLLYGTVAVGACSACGVPHLHLLVVLPPNLNRSGGPAHAVAPHDLDLLI